jgi:hypothetical protein
MTVAQQKICNGIQLDTVTKDAILGDCLDIYRSSVP